MIRIMPVKDRTLVSFGQNVARIRDQRGYSQDKLAEKADLDPTYISDIERGRRNPGIKNVAKLAMSLGLTTSELCKGVDA